MRKSRASFSPKILHYCIFIRQLAEEFARVRKTVEKHTERYEFAVVFIQTAAYPLYLYPFMQAGERRQQLPYAPIEKLDLEHQGETPDSTGVPMDLK